MVAEAPRKAGERGSTISVFAKVKARNLYLNQGLSVPAVAKEVGVAYSTVRKWVEREGWATERKTTYSRLVAKTDAQVDATQNLVAEAIASYSEQHALRGLERTGEALERNDEFAAKDFQAYTAGVKNLVGIVKTLRDPNSSTGGETTNFNLFFMAAPAQVTKESEPKNVTPKAVSTE